MTDCQICSLTENLNADVTRISGAQNTQNQTIMILTIDLSDMLRITAENMKWSYDWGRSSVNGMPTTVLPQSQCTFTSKIYVGIYDNVSYGVYDDNDKLQKSMGYWHPANVNSQEFASYEEAFDFARNGVAKLKGVPVNSIPDMKCALNWRQKI